MSSPSISALTAGISFSATIAALRKMDMKPSRTPCFLSKLSRWRSRTAIASVISISLKVVSIAAVFCAAFNRSAMRRRSRVMRTRTSRSSGTAHCDLRRHRLGLRSERVGDEMGLLFNMALEETGGWGRGLGTARETRALGGDVEPGEHMLDAPVDKVPGSHILWLFLAPDDLGIAVALQHLA